MKVLLFLHFISSGLRFIVGHRFRPRPDPMLTTAVALQHTEAAKPPLSHVFCAESPDALALTVDELTKHRLTQHATPLPLRRGNVCVLMASGADPPSASLLRRMFLRLSCMHPCMIPRPEKCFAWFHDRVRALPPLGCRTVFVHPCTTCDIARKRCSGLRGLRCHTRRWRRERRNPSHFLPHTIVRTGRALCQGLSGHHARVHASCQRMRSLAHRLVRMLACTGSPQ